MTYEEAWQAIFVKLRARDTQGALALCDVYEKTAPTARNSGNAFMMRASLLLRDGGNPREVRYWLDRAATSLRPYRNDSGLLCVVGLSAAGQYADFADADGWIAKFNRLYQTAPPADLKAKMLGHQALVLRADCRYMESAECLRESYSLWCSSGGTFANVAARNNALWLAWTHLQMGESSVAEHWLEQAGPAKPSICLADIRQSVLAERLIASHQASQAIQLVNQVRSGGNDRGAALLLFTGVRAAFLSGSPTDAPLSELYRHITKSHHRWLAEPIWRMVNQWGARGVRRNVMA